MQGWITFNVTAFRTQFSNFVDDVAYPSPTLQNWWNIATNFVSNRNYGWLNGAARAQVLNLLTAHLAALNDMIAAGQTTAMVKGAQIDKVDITLQPPPVTNQTSWWYNLTSYGQQAYALLTIISVGGMTIGGSPQRAAFQPTNCWPFFGGC